MTMSGNRRRYWMGGGSGATVAGVALAVFLTHGVIVPSKAGPAEAAQTPPKEAASVTVKTAQLHQLDIVPVREESFRQQKAAFGQIAFNEDASTTVLTPFSGRVTRLIAKVGEDVKRGDPLFEIDSPEVVQAQTDLIAAVLAVEKSKSQLGLAKRVLDRQTALLADKATAMREVEQARNDYASAESDFNTQQGALAAARNRLRVIIGRDDGEISRVERERIVNPLITINAPIDGTVTNRKIGPGQYVRADAAETLFAISDLSTMWLKAFVPEMDIPYVRVGQELEVKITALPRQTFTARVVAIGSASDPTTRRVVVRSEIKNPDRQLRAEMFATFKILVGDIETAPAVPVDAVIREGQDSSVWVQKQDPLAFQRRAVEIGMEQEGRVQVRQGVKSGEMVVGRGAIFVDSEAKQ